ncbi:MAG: DNA methyltransferase [Bacteroidetes bacterium]|nr:DNA methyltransferase [Bacteroidota bacterium]
MPVTFSETDPEYSDLLELLGKPSCPTEFCVHILENGSSTSDKREALSSIGRKKDAINKPLLFQYADHRNPEVAMQAIRGLLVFRGDQDVLDLLHKLSSHPNDMIKDLIDHEIMSENQTNENSHSESPDKLKNVLIEGDVSKIIRCIPDDSIHLTFTSPPYYNARDYSIYSSYTEYLNFLETVFLQLHRVTKEGRFFVLNTSPVIIPRVGRKYSSRRYAVPFDLHARLAQMGWDFIDDIIWAKPEKSAKNRISNFNQKRKPLTYKANSCTEYVMVYRKKSGRLIDWNLRQYDTDVLRASLVDDHFERSNIWQIPPKSSKLHTAIFPEQLCSQVIKLYSFVGDLIFDPFAGSGTLGLVAKQLQRNYLLTELCKEYADVIENRLGLPEINSSVFRRMTLQQFIDDIRS